MNPKHKKDVIKFLKYCDIYFSKRDKNDEFRRKYALTIDDLKDIVRSLDIYDCIEGPKSDEDIRLIGSVYIFLKKIVDIGWCYIKIRVINEDKPIIVISIHESKKGEKYERLL